MTELLSLPDLPANQVASAQMLVAVPTAAAASAYKVALGTYLPTAAAAATYAPLSGPSFTGSPTAPTAPPGDNSALIATTAFVTTGFVSRAARVASTSGGVTISPSDGTVFVKMTTAGPTTVTLYSSPQLGALHVIKDARGDAATNNITIVATNAAIDGQASFVLNMNYAAISLIFNGTDWSVV